MDELAATGAEGIRILAGMLVPAGQGSDAAVEYALSGVVHHVTEQGRGEARDAVRQGLAQSIDTCPDPADRAFLISLLACCSTAEDAAVFAKYADDGQLADAAVRGLIATPGSEPAIVELMQQSDGPSALLAHAAAKRPGEGAEEILLAWLADYPTDDTTREAIYAALAACGGRASLRVLGDAAAAADFDFALDDATGAFLDLLNNLAGRGDTKVVQRAARVLAKGSVRTNIRTAALELLLRTAPRTAHRTAARGARGQRPGLPLCGTHPCSGLRRRGAVRSHRRRMAETDGRGPNGCGELAGRPPRRFADRDGTGRHRRFGSRARRSRRACGRPSRRPGSTRGADRPAEQPAGRRGRNRTGLVQRPGGRRARRGARCRSRNAGQRPATRRPTADHPGSRPGLRPARRRAGARTTGRAGGPRRGDDGGGFPEALRPARQRHGERNTANTGRTAERPGTNGPRGTIRPNGRADGRIG